MLFDAHKYITLLAARPPPLLLRSLWADGLLSTAADEVAAWLGMLKAMTWGSSGPTSASSFPANAARLLLPRSLASHTSCHAANLTSGLHWLQSHTHHDVTSLTLEVLSSVMEESNSGAYRESRSTPIMRHELGLASGQAMIK